ncbi:hypothetical protein ACFVH4_09470 [Nocardia ignorata]|uniref:hypothetical protein n=1 Tax=Nocardia ignorata TaxID=145285 RepID=UPI00363985F8
MTADPAHTQAPTGQGALRGSTDLLELEFAEQLGAQLAANDEFQALLTANNHLLLQSTFSELSPGPEWAHSIAAQLAPAPADFTAHWYAPTLPGSQHWATAAATLASDTAARLAHSLAPTIATSLNAPGRWMSTAQMLGVEEITAEVSSWAKRVIAIKRNRDQIRALILLALELERAAQRAIRAGIQIYGLTELLRSTRNRLREALLRSSTATRLRHRGRHRGPTAPPGHAVAARPCVSRGPNTCRSIAIPRSPAGLTHT